MPRILLYLFRAFSLLLALAFFSIANAVALRVGVADLRPDIYQQTDGRLGGILGEILNEIALSEGWEIKAQPCLWADCMRLLQTAAIDLLPDVRYTPERAQILEFNQVPVLSRSTQIYAPEGTFLDTLSDLVDKRIAILAGSAQYEILKAKLAQLQINARLITIQSLVDGFQLVRDGKADATVADYFFGALAAPQYRLSATPIVFETGKIFYAVPKGHHSQVLARIDAYLKDWKANPDSSYYRTLERWGHPLPKPLSSWHAHWVILLSLTLLLLAAIGYGWHQRGHSLASLRRLLIKEKEFDRVCAEQEHMQEQVQQAVFFDVLTNLPNRRMLIKRIEQVQAAIKLGSAVAAVMVLDLDRFRKINKGQGLAVGDYVLQEIAKRLIANTQASDSVSRTDGDEFTILLTGLGTSTDDSRKMAMKMAEKLHLALVTEPLNIQGKPYQLSVSIGLTLLDESEQNVSDILREASIATQQAEDLGGNCVVLFNQDIQEKAEYLLALEQDLAVAIKSKQLHLHLQPQYASDGQVAGAELLARWSHPIHGAIPPLVFIPLVRDRSLLRDLTGQVLKQACGIVLDFRRQGETYPISLNVSPETLSDSLFIRLVHETLDRTPIAAGDLIFEITEEIQANNMEIIVQHMHELNARGIHFSIDDFGTGYSNLATLNHLPIHELKIDKSLVDGVPHRHDSVAIIQLILTLAQTLGVRVVAEGVENQAQADLLFKYQCDAVQGYLMARPLPVEAWLKQRSCRAVAELPMQERHQ